MSKVDEVPDNSDTRRRRRRRKEEKRKDTRQPEEEEKGHDEEAKRQGRKSNKKRQGRKTKRQEAVGLDGKSIKPWEASVDEVAAEAGKKKRKKKKPSSLPVEAPNAADDSLFKSAADTNHAAGPPAETVNGASSGANVISGPSLPSEEESVLPHHKTKGQEVLSPDGGVESWEDSVSHREMSGRRPGVSAGATASASAASDAASDSAGAAASATDNTATTVGGPGENPATAAAAGAAEEGPTTVGGGENDGGSSAGLEDFDDLAEHPIYTPPDDAALPPPCPEAAASPTPDAEEGDLWAPNMPHPERGPAGGPGGKKKTILASKEIFNGDLVTLRYGASILLDLNPQPAERLLTAKGTFIDNAFRIELDEMVGALSPLVVAPLRVIYLRQPEGELLYLDTDPTGTVSARWPSRGGAGGQQWSRLRLETDRSGGSKIYSGDTIHLRAMTSGKLLSVDPKDKVVRATTKDHDPTNSFIIEKVASPFPEK